MFRSKINLDYAFEQIHGESSIVSYSPVPTISNRPTMEDPFDVDPEMVDWEWNPVGFKEFCESKEHMNLLPKDWKEGDAEGALSNRQLIDCLAILGDDPKKIFDPTARKYTFGGLLWSKGCNHGSQEVRDDNTGRVFRIDQLCELYKQGFRISIRSYNEKLKSFVTKPVADVFSKGMSNLLHIYLKSGIHKIVSPKHRFFTGRTWVWAEQFIQGDMIAANRMGHIVYEQIEHISTIMDAEVFDLTIDEETPNYCTADGILNHNSGKDYVCAIMQAYVTHVLLCMKSPQAFFGFGPGEPCDILNVGQKGDQAQRVYFTKFKNRIINWSWLLDKYRVVEGGKQINNKAKTYPVCDIGKRSITFSDKSVRCFTENSGNPESLDGYNIIFFICDEISAWVSEKEREISKTILKILRTSQGSRNTKALRGIGMAISYPRQDDDIMFDIEKESFEPNSKTFFSRAYQWEVKPKSTYSGDTFKFNAGTEEMPEWFDIPIELEEDYFKNNPEEAKCVYLLKPPPVGGQWGEYIDKFDAISRQDRSPLFKIATEVVDAIDGYGKKIQYIRKRILGLNRQPQQVDYVIWLDAAESTCDASLSIGHTEMVTLIEGSERRETTVVVLDDTIVWEPNPEKRIIVDIGSMTTCVLEMRKYITIKAAWWDQWNSGTGMKDFRDGGIMCDKHNLNVEDYDFYKGLIYTSRFYGPACPQVKKGIEQLKHLSRSRTNIVCGSSKHKKDIADTWCGVVTLLMGSLAQKNLRIGHAPSAINIMGSTSTTTAVDGAMSGAASARANNPFSAQSNGPQRVRDHSDLFRSLNPAAQHSGNSMGMGGSRTITPRSAEQAAKSRFPRGISL